MADMEKPLEDLAKQGIWIFENGVEIQTILVVDHQYRCYAIGPKEQEGTIGFSYDINRVKKSDLRGIWVPGNEDGYQIVVKNPERYYQICSTIKELMKYCENESNIEEVSVEEYKQKLKKFGY